MLAYHYKLQSGDIILKATFTDFSPFLIIKIALILSGISYETYERYQHGTLNVVNIGKAQLINKGHTFESHIYRVMPLLILESILVNISYLLK
jgi:hypothetical protein